MTSLGCDHDAKMLAGVELLPNNGLRAVFTQNSNQVMYLISDSLGEGVNSVGREGLAGLHCWHHSCSTHGCQHLHSSMFTLQPEQLS